MLNGIYIENIALITKLRMEFQEGFSVITGETGAGKSILLDAMALILGAKADTQLIRHGSEKALVEGVFTNLRAPVLEKMLAYGLEGEELILTREMAIGKSSSRINGRNFPLNVLREFGEKLVNIYGQHDFQTLAKAENHLSLLDAFLPNIASQKLKVADAAEELARLTKEFNELNRLTQESAKELDYLTFQVKEIDDAALDVAEEEELLSRQKLLANAEKIINALSSTYNALYGSKSRSVSDLLGEAAKSLSSISNFGEEFERFSNILEDISIQSDELALEVKAFLDNIEYSPGELEKLEERLYVIKTLKKKYGASIPEILEYRENIESKLSLIVNSEENQSRLEEEIERQKAKYLKEAEVLSALRKQSAQMLREKITVILAEMNMTADMETKFSKREGYSKEGAENAEFYIRTNAGEEYKPLVKIASGGELARLMLALRTVLNDLEPVPTLIFDEVDAGMGGATLARVGHKISSLAQNTQVLCVTHAAQLAAVAGQHFFIQKEEKDGKTFTNVQLLAKEERISEISRMLDGKITSAGLEHAKELLTMRN